MVDSVYDEMEVPNNFIVGQIVFRVEDKSMKEIFS